jgi:hypothetical protein
MEHMEHSQVFVQREMSESAPKDSRMRLRCVDPVHPTFLMIPGLVNIQKANWKIAIEIVDKIP